MSWIGYFVYGGNEVINLPRTEAYAGPAYWFRPSGDGSDLATMTGEGRYTTPIVDRAPWTDPDDFASYDFWGFYPLDVSGIDDATVTSTITESTGDGGTPGRVRRATKTIVFNGLILAASECGADYGMKWLRNTLNGNACGNLATQTCNGDDLCYLACEPALDFDTSQSLLIPGTPGTPGTPGSPGSLNDLDGGSAADDVTSFSVNGGGAGAPTGDTLDGGGANASSIADTFDATPPTGTTPAWDGGTAASAGPDTMDGCNADLSCAPGTPGTPGDPGTPDVVVNVDLQPQDPQVCLDEATRSLRRVVFNNGPTVLSKRITSDGAAVWNVQFTAVAGNPYEFSVEKPVVQGFMDPTVTNPYAPGLEGQVDLDGRIVDDATCIEPIIAPIYDPLCPALVVPPSVPNVSMGCYTTPVNWHRRQFTIPKSLIPLHSDAVPLMRVYARDAEVRNLRLRFYADVNGDGSILDDPCAWCGDIVMSFIPHDMTMVFDASDKQVYVESRGGLRRRADNLVFATDGGPFEWPAMTCGFGYIVTVDLPQTQAPPVVDFSLFSRVA